MPDIRVEMAFGADPAGDPAGWEWTDVTATPAGHLLAQDVTITMGRPDGDSQATPASATVTLDNPGGWLTPGHPSSPWWPHVVQGVPCRIWVRAGTPHALVPDRPGARIQTTAAVPVPTDLDVRVDVALDQTPAQYASDGLQPWAHEWQELCGQWQASGLQRSWLMVGNTVGGLSLRWSPDGTTSWVTAQIFEGAPYASGQRVTLRATLDVDNGSGGWTFRSYYGPSVDGPWTVLGETSGDGVTALSSSTAAVTLGDFADWSYIRAAGRYYGVQIHDGIDGPVLASADFTTMTVGDTSMTDEHGVTWELVSGTEITDWQRRLVGAADEISPYWPHGDLSDPDRPSEAPGEARVDVTVAGVLRRLSSGQPPLQSTLRRYVSAHAGTLAYWPLEDGAEATSAASGLRAGAAAQIARLDMASESSLPSSAPLPRIGQDGGVFRAPLPGLPDPALGWRVEMVYYLDELPAASRGWFRVVTAGGGIATITGYIGAGEARIILRDQDGVTVAQQFWTDSTALATAIAGWCRVRIVAVPNGADWDYRLWWTPIGRTESWYTGVVAHSDFTHPTRVDCVWHPDLAGMPIGHITMSNDPSVDVYGAGTGGPDDAYRGERAISRMRRLAVEEGLPISVAGGTFQSRRMGPQRIDTLLGLLQECADADGGILSERRTVAGLQYTPRQLLYSRPGMTLDARAKAAGKPASEIAAPFDPVLDDQRHRNAVTVSRVNGSSYTAQDVDDIARSGRRDGSRELNIHLDSDLPGIAYWDLHLGTWPGMRYPQVGTDLMVAPQRVDDWLDAAPATRITVTGLPPQHPPGEVELTAEHITETIGPEYWSTTATCSPGGPWEVFVLGDRIRGRLETGGSELATEVAAGDTELLVATDTGSQPWIDTDTYADHFPLNIWMGGEVVRVTGISGTGQLQTLTVVRSVNGVSKGHTAGTRLRLSRSEVGLS